MSVGSKTASKTQEYRFPDFIGIGAQKAGTSWLDKNLRLHPKLWLPPIKELHYFDDLHVPTNKKWTADHRRRRGVQVLTRYLKNVPPEKWIYSFIARAADIVESKISDDWYGRIFALARPEQLCGEITPDYCTLPDEGICHILRLSPEVKIILSLRDPIERSWSHIRMLAKRRKAVGLPQMEQFARHVDIFRRADYPAIIEKWREHVARENLLIISMDDIVAKPLIVLAGICKFLNIEFNGENFGNADLPVHVGEASIIPPTVYGILKERLRPTYDKLSELPEIEADWASRHF